MEQVWNFLSNLGGTESWPERWNCGRWSEFHGWLYIFSDLAVWLAYYTIPFLLINFIIRKKDVPFPKIFWLFGAFILACGTTHLIDALMFWWPAYRVNATVRFITAVTSWGTIFALHRILPHAFSLKTPAELERVVNERTDQLHRSIGRMRFLADAIPQMVFTATPEGVIDHYNRIWKEFAGLTEGKMLVWKEVVHPDDLDATVKQWEHALDSGSDFDMQHRLRDSRGRYGWYLTRALAQRDEDANILMWVGTSTNIENQKKMEVLLEEEVRKRTRELEMSNQDLERFAAIASHDLQEPLRTISSYLQLLEKRMGGNLDPESREYIEFTIDGAKRMKGLILNLLEYSRVNRSRARFGEVDLNEVLSNVVSNLHEQIKEKEAGIKVGKMPVLRADSFQLTQLFQNLIGNAVKFNNTSSPLVEVNYEEKDGEHLFRIRDNGIGIEERYLERIFQIFERLHNREEYSGSGIGLAICKRIVENHNGRIWAESGAGKGTTFFFTISKGV